jgi:hypothetical protein
MFVLKLSVPKFRFDCGSRPQGLLYESHFEITYLEKLISAYVEQDLQPCPTEVVMKTPNIFSILLNLDFMSLVNIESFLVFV